MKEHCRNYALAIMMVGALVFAAPISVLAGHVIEGDDTGHNGPERKTEDVKATIHNLSSSMIIDGINISSVGAVTSEGEVCVFCHTPHGANLNSPGSAPLWNRAVPLTSGYQMYNSPNFEETSVSPVGVSLACLSCHDGTIALDALVNAPKSGGFRSANLIASTSVSIGLITGPGGSSAFLESDNSMSEGTRTDTGTNYQQITGGAQPFPNLTTDLRDDHPISFEFPNGVGATTDPQFTDRTINNAGGNVGFISSPGLEMPTDKRDRIRMYPPQGANDWTSGPGWVECASCHNPHAPRPLVLRMPNQPTAIVITDTAIYKDFSDWPNQGSAVCLTCHDK